MATCNCKKHAFLTGYCETDSNDNPLLDISKSKKVPRYVFDKAVKQGLLSVKSNYICTVCMNCIKSMIGDVSGGDQCPPSRKRPYLDVNQMLTDFFMCLN